ncbi:glycosyltransferase family 39 protein [Massilia sp. UMI-21]|nr:glycosyltransferase family 39 protein [Massilia sp. UMI-21]
MKPSSPPEHALARPRARSRVPALLLGAGMALIGWYLIQRTLGLYPGIFMDEWYYSKMARLTPLSEAAVPSYLYLLVFGASSGCGPGFLDCVRIGNALFHVGAAPFLYLVARRVLPAPLACTVALLALLLPLNLYTSYFMPESMYFFGFALLAWVALAGVAWRAWVHALLAGAVLGLMSLVKVHAVFLLPALCVYLVLASRARDPQAAAGAWIGRGLGAAALAALAAAAVKLLLGWLLAGEAGLTLFGAFYSAGASSASQHGILSRLLPASVSARGHAMGLAVLLALPLAALLHALVRPVTHRAGNPLGLLAVFTALMLGSALGLAVMYTASIASDGPLEGFRLHSRYYSFALPLLLIVGAAAAGREAREAQDQATRPAFLAQALIALVLAGLLALAWTRLPGFDPRITDGPEFTALVKRDHPVIALFALQALLLALWLGYRRAAAWGYLLLALPLALYVTDVEVRTYLGHLRTAPPADRAGIAARARIPPAERSATMIVANGADLFRTQFHLDHADMILLDLPDGAPIEAYRLPTAARWLVAVGRHPLPTGMVPALADDAFTIVKLPRPARSLVGEFVFNVAPGPGRLVEQADGLSNVEGWGRWSEGRLVRLHFARPLPARLTVVLTAGAFGPNTGLPFILRAGQAETPFRLAWEAREVVLDLDTDGRQQTLVIEVPQPQRPSELGNSTDTRLLGISLTRLRIEARKPAD